MIPAQFAKEADGFPPLLKALLEAELAAGNGILKLGYSFPAAPIGAYFIMSGPFSTRPRASGDGLTFRDFGYSEYSGSFTDERGHFFLLEPPVPPPPQPTMDEIRAARNDFPLAKPRRPDPPLAPPETALGRFQRSMEIDYMKWHDGIGYDLDAIAEATAEEREAIETILTNRGNKDWRDTEALAALNPPAPISQAARIQTLVNGLRTQRIYEGLTQTLDEVEEFHPKEIIDALLDGALHREGETAVHFAAMLMFIHGKAESSFDWDQRPFFLRFNTEDRAEREAVFAELCEKLGITRPK